MPSGRTSRPALQAPDLLATLPACSGRRQNGPCRRHHECKLGDQTKDDADKEPREERSCGRSQTSLYNRTRRHSAIGYISPSEMELKAASPCPFFRGKISKLSYAAAKSMRKSSICFPDLSCAVI